MMKGLLIPVEEYLSTMYHPDCEYVDGVLVERNLGERDHSRWQLMLGAYLSTREKLWGIYTFTEWRARVKPNRFRIPDLTVVKGSWPRGRVLEQPAFLVIEILSPDDRPRELQEKISDYRELGIPYILVIYPEEPRFVLYTQTAEQELHDGVLRTENPAIEIPLLDIYNGIPREN